MHRVAIAIIFSLPATTSFAAIADPCKADDLSSVQSCATAELARADKALNSAYQKVLRDLTPPSVGDPKDLASSKAMLIEAQRAWVKFRDNDCNAIAPLIGSGTARLQAVTGCKIQRTEQRTKELNTWWQS
jgi:uncharacterized protein YecT (DUF1311 family)